jgi:hypothetical protein
MPFSITTKTEMFVRSGRLCCLCLKQCNTNIEAAHIIDESKGGSNDADNGIPVCFDCHLAMGAYNDQHPRGNKLREEELKARRDRLYRLVDTGVIYAQIVAIRSRSEAADTAEPDLVEPSASPDGSTEAKRFLSILLSPSGLPDAPARKLNLFNERDRAWILDQLLAKAAENAQAISIIGPIVQSPTFPQSQAVLLLEHLVRAVTLYGTVTAKAELLRACSNELLSAVYDGLRVAFFDDLISIAKKDQFDEVNEIVPALVDHVDAIPEELHKEYVMMLLDQARSNSYRGAPAARRALMALPEAVAKLGMDAMDSKFLTWNSRYDHVKRFVTQYKHLANPNQVDLLNDLMSLSDKKFLEKYMTDD